MQFEDSQLVLVAVALRENCQADGSSDRFCQAGSWWQHWEMKKKNGLFILDSSLVYVFRLLGYLVAS